MVSVYFRIFNTPRIMTIKSDLINGIAAFILISLTCLPGAAKSSGYQAGEPVFYTGTVTDTKNKPMENVVVKAITRKGDIVSYCLSNRNGRFRLSINDGKKADSIQASLMGYESVSRPIGAPGNKGVFRLQENPKLLEEVLIKSPWAYKRGDTLVYNVDSLISKSDVAIEDVIKKIPGVQVHGNGQILYNGKPINKFYIENADMLEGRYTLATRNIAAKDVSSVSIYENHQPIKALEDLVPSDEAALNIKLKAERLLRPVGHFKLGAGGEKDRFNGLAEVFGLSVSPKMQILGNFQFNNSGKRSLDFLTSHYGGMLFRQPVAATVGSSPAAAPPFEESAYKKGNSSIASLNFLARHSPVRQTRANIDAYNNTGDYSGSTVTTYRTPDGDADRETVISNAFNSHSRKSSVTAAVNYTINDKTIFLDNKLYGGLDYDKNLTHVYTGRHIPQYINRNLYKAGNTLYFTVRKGMRAFTISSVTLFSSSPRSRLRAFEAEPAEPAENGYSTENIIFNQLTKGSLVYNKESTSFQTVLFSCLSAGVNLQFEAEYQTFNSADRTTAEGPFVTGNNLSGTQIMLSAAPYIGWTSKGGKFDTRLTVPFTQHFNSYKNSPGDIDRRSTPFTPGIRLNIRWLPYKFHTLLLKASASSALSGFNSFITGPLYFDYRSFGAMGSGFDSRRKFTSVGADYTYKRVLAGFNLNVSYNYSRNSSDRLRTVNVSPDETVTGYSDSKSISFSHIVNTRINKVFRGTGIHTGAEISARFSTSRMSLQSRIFDAKNTGLTIMPFLRLSIVKNILETSSTFSYNTNIQRSGEAGRITSDNYSFQETVYFTPGEKFTGSIDFRYTDSEIGPDNRKRDAFLDMNFNYKLNRGVELGLSLENLTNRREYTITSFSDAQTITVANPLRGIRALATVKISY